MDTINKAIEISQGLKQFNIDLVIVALVLAGGFFQKKYLADWKINSALKTLAISTLFTALYIVTACDLASWECLKPCLLTALISYCLSTSFYELIIKQGSKIIKKFSNGQTNIK